METYKTGTVNTIINEHGVDLGNINVNLYTMDNMTSVIDIHLKKKNLTTEQQEYIPVNFNQTKFKPILHVFAQDGSIFTNEPLEIIKPEEGYVRYIIPEYITKHVGQMQCKLFLENPENNNSSHVANFYFTVNDSGITKSVGKEIRVELLGDIVEKVLKDNVEIFKGPKGNKGEQGIPGQDGKDGKNGLNGIDGINGNPGPQGKPGKDGKDGIDGLNGEKGEPFRFEDFTPEQLASLKGSQGERGVQGEQGPVGPAGPIGPKGVDGVIKFENLTEEQKSDLRSGLNYNVVNNVNDLMSKINMMEGSNFKLPVFTPNNFALADYPIKNKIFTNGRGQFYVNYDVGQKKLKGGKTYYVNYISGSDSNDGLTKETAFKSINYAISKVQDNDTVILCEGTHFRNGGSLLPKPTSKSINIIGESNKVNVVWGDEPVWKKTEGKNNVYEFARTSVSNVIDLKSDISFKSVDSIQNVDNTINSWYTDDSKVYTNCGSTPDKNVIPILKGSSVQVNNIVSDLYIENVNFIGGNNCLQVDLSKNNNLYLKNVSFSFSNYLYNGLAVTGGESVILQNCSANNNGFDGFNYHIGKDQSLPLVIEINCRAYENGNDKGTAGFKSNNGTTTHDGITSIRVNGVYARNDGGNVADVNEGTKSWNVGCSAFESYQGKDFQTASGSDMWLENCIAYGSENSINSYDENSVIYTRSGDFKNKLIIGKEIKY